MFLISLFTVVVRIGILVEVDSIHIQGEDYRIKSNDHWYKAKGYLVLKPQLVEYNGKRTKGIDYPLKLVPQQDFIEVNSRSYPGWFLIKKANLGLVAINYVDLEEYVTSVVRFEMGSLVPEHFEALKAQAVAARTYCISHLGRKDELGFDLFSGIQDQVYLGYVGDSIIKEAVYGTEGEVLVYNHQPIDAKYHSTCGGVTALPSDVWPVKGVPYLQSVDDHKFCRNSPHYSWHRNFSIPVFAKVLRKITHAKSSSRLKLKIVRNKVSRRVLRVKVIENNTIHTIAGYRFRNIFDLKSTFFRIKIEDDSIIIYGHGWGHGVGMCQWGAIGMSEKGYNYRAVLHHYYPRTKLGRLR